MFQIKSDDQRQKTLKRIEALRAQVEQVRRDHGPKLAHNFEVSLRAHLQELEAQIHEYDRLKREGPGPFHPRDLSEVGRYLVKARIAGSITQAELAKQLGVSQPMVYKYELTEYQGVSLGVLSKVANILGVSLDIEAVPLLRKVEYNPAKQEAVMLFFMQHINNEYLGRTKLMKLLYYSDYEWIQSKRISITGDAYLALQHGPVPKHGRETLRRLSERGIIQIIKTQLGDYDQERYMLVSKPDYSALSEEELNHLEAVARRFERWSASDLSGLSHEEEPWLSTPFGNEIRYFAAQ